MARPGKPRHSALAMGALSLVLAGLWTSAAAAAPVPRPGDVLSERYRIDAQLGAGGMAVVYAATELRSGERVAIKWMSTRRGEDAHRGLRLVREFDAVAGLEHPNVVRMDRIGRHRGRFYLVMELLEDDSLERLLEAHKLEAPLAIAIAQGVLDGLIALHARGVVHRDLKPANIIVTRAEQGGMPVPKLIDFGLAKKLNRAGISAGGRVKKRQAKRVDLTQDGVALGTPLYMAPEQIERPQDVDGRADLYALGVVLYQMLSGRVPFEGANTEALMAKVKAGAATPLIELQPDVGQQLSDVVMHALARDPEARHADAASLARALTQASAHLQDTALDAEAASALAGSDASDQALDARNPESGTEASAPSQAALGAWSPLSWSAAFAATAAALLALALLRLRRRR